MRFPIQSQYSIGIQATVQFIHGYKCRRLYMYFGYVTLTAVQNELKFNTFAAAAAVLAHSECIRNEKAETERHGIG